MADLNKVILMGHMTADPELKQTASGISVCSFSIGVNSRYSKAEEGQQPTTDVSTEPKAEAENPEQGRGGDRRFPNRGRQHRHHNRRPNGGKSEGKSEPKVE